MAYTGELADDHERKAFALMVKRLDEGNTIDAFWLGIAYQRALDASAAHLNESGTRRARGIFYTPEPLVRHIVEQACTGDLVGASETPLRILDPACGCGGFLIAAARRLRDMHLDMPIETIARSLHGTDIDPHAVSLCRLALWLELGDHNDPADTPVRFTRQIHVADALLTPQVGRPCDLVLGNPPFLGQLASRTTRSRTDTTTLRKRFGSSVRPYTDPAALFLQLAIDSIRPGGRVGMVLPVSLLASRDAAPVRKHIDRTATMRSLWLDRDGIFNAQVRSVAMLFDRHPSRPQLLTRYIGSKFERAAPCSLRINETQSWGPRAADLTGVQRVCLHTSRRLGDVCDITAGFRDEYYAIARHLREMREIEREGRLPASVRRVATVAMIDPARNTWAQRPVRIARQQWEQPCVSLDAGEPVLATLLSRQGHPKLLIATQTRVIEVAADPGGLYIALTPVITVIPHDPADLWSLGALLSCPAVSAWLAAQTFGTARSIHAIKPSAALLRDLPCPVNLDTLSEAAKCYHRATTATDAEARTQYLAKAAHASNLACGVAEAESQTLVAWWRSRLPEPQHTRLEHSPPK